MNNKQLFWIIGTVIIGLLLINYSQKFAISDFSSEKQDLINYLHSLEGKNVLIGQASYPELWGTPRTGWKEFDQIKNLSGKEVTILDMNYYRGGNVSCENYVNESNAYITEWHNKGGIAAVSIFMINPFNHQGFQNRSNVNLTDMLINGTSSNIVFNKELDCIAGGLKELQDKGIVVMFKPWGEFNGNWNWWSANPSKPDEFKNLWKYTYDYLVIKNDLKNLLFVYNANANSGNYLTYYDTNYVDIVSLDKYTNDPLNNSALGYTEMFSTGKPFGFSEYSPYAANNPNRTAFYCDSLPWLEAVKTKYPKASFMVAYSWVWGLQNQQNLSIFMNDSYVITLDEYVLHQCMTDKCNGTIYYKCINERLVNQGEVPEHCGVPKATTNATTSSGGGGSGITNATNQTVTAPVTVTTTDNKSIINWILIISGGAVLILILKHKKKK